MLPMWIMRDTFFANYRENGGTDAYIDAVMALTPDYMVLVIIDVALGVSLGMLLTGFVFSGRYGIKIRAFKQRIFKRQ